VETNWKSAEMVAAEEVLAQRAAAVDQAIAAARSAGAKAKATPLTDKEIADIDAAARTPDAPEELRRVAEKVGYGQLSWQEVFSANGMRDPEVRAALAEFRLPREELAAIEAIARAYQDGDQPAPATRPADDSFEHHTFRL
jgi:sugar/nucleoside kinase (ribokinase family)